MFTSEDITKRARDIQQALAPFQLHICWKAYQRITPGISWVGCTKKHLMRAYARGEHVDLMKASISDVRRAILAVLAQQYGYQEISPER